MSTTVLAPFATFALVGHLLTALLCTAITLIVVLQLRHDLPSRAFAGLTTTIAAMAVCGILIRLAALLHSGGLYELFTVAGILTGLLPGLLFLFTAAYFEAWTPWRRWLACLLIAAFTVAVWLGLSRQLFDGIVVSPEGFLTYTARPASVALLGIGAVGVLGSLHIVIDVYRRSQAALDARLVAGIGLIGLGILSLVIPGLSQYTVEQKLYALGSILLVGPVLRQRLFDPLTQLNKRLLHRAEQFTIITRVGQQAAALLDLDTLLHAVAAEIQRAFGYARVTLYLPDKPDSSTFMARTVAATSSGEGDNRCVLQAAERARLLAAGRVVDAGAKWPTLRLALMVGPLEANQRQMVGLLDIQDRRVESLQAEDLEVLAILARQIGVAIRNAELFAEAQQARHQADAANRHKTQFLSFMSHEVRTPLQTILAHSQWMLHHPELYQDVPLPAPYSSDMALMVKAGQHLQQLIVNILDLNRIEAGELELVIRPVDPLLILRDVQDTYLSALAAGVTFETDYPRKLPLVAADDLRLKQALGNLLANACKFCQQGTIRLEARVQETMLRLAVADTGPGIPLAAQSQLFQQFKQANTHITRAYGGSGLGLHIAQQLVRLHGGEIGFESIEGQGATFFFTIPLATPGDSVACSSGEESSPVTFFKTHQSRVPLQLVVIDADLDTRNQLLDRLAGSGYKALSAATAAEGFALTTALAPAGAIVVRHPDSPTAFADLLAALNQADALPYTHVMVAEVTGSADWLLKVMEQLALIAR